MYYNCVMFHKNSISSLVGVALTRYCRQLSTKIYDKRDDFNFKIINFPNMCSNIPASPAYGVYISQLIRYARASNYSDFLKRNLHLRNRLLDQGYKKIRLIRSLKKLYSDTKILSKYIPSLQKRL